MDQPSTIERLRRVVRSIMTDVTNLFMPPWCLSCQRPGTWLCADCESTMRLLPFGWCGRCQRRAPAETTLCRRCATTLHLTKVTSAYPYCDTVEAVLRVTKYRPARIGLATVIPPAVLARLTTQLPSTGPVVPIPLHRGRWKRRGFNQAELLAERLLGPAQRGRLSRQLARMVDRPAQVGLTRLQRRTNTIGVFRWEGSSLAGQTVCLVDDVLTTGATLADAARALRAAGARRVVALILAMTPPDRRRRSGIGRQADLL